MHKCILAFVCVLLIIIAIAAQFFSAEKCILTDTAIIPRTALGENIQVHFRFRLCFILSIVEGSLSAFRWVQGFKNPHFIVVALLKTSLLWIKSSPLSFVY